MSKQQPVKPAEPAPAVALSEPLVGTVERTLDHSADWYLADLAIRQAELAKSFGDFAADLRRRLDEAERRPAGPAFGEGPSSPSVAQLVTALSAAQAELQNPVKNRTANVRSEKGSYSYDYADLASVLDAVRPVLSKHGLSVVQFPAIEQAGRVSVRTVLAHKSGEWVAAGLSAGADSARPQGIGSAITYLRRYTVQALVGITAESDDDATIAQGLPAETKAKQAETKPLEREETIGTASKDGAKATKEQRATLNAAVTARATALAVDRAIVALEAKEYMKKIGVASGSSADLPKARFDEVLKYVEKVAPATAGGDDE